MIKKAFSFKNMKAIALLVNSPGGSPVQSALIANRIRDLAKEKEIPVYCGETQFILDTSAQIMLESQILIGEVRRGGQPFGDVIGILSFGHSVERNSGTFFMTIPGIGVNGESLTCILGYGMNWQFFDDEGNAVLEGDSL